MEARHAGSQGISLSSRFVMMENIFERKHSTVLRGRTYGNGELETTCQGYADRVSRCRHLTRQGADFSRP